MLHDLDVAILGGGISGLSAAWELTRHSVRTAVFERAPRAGGIVRTDRVDGFVLDAGPDALLIQKPAALTLCREIGIADRLIPTRPPRSAFVLRDGRLHPLPPASMLGFPTRAKALLDSTLFGPAAKARMAAELVVPRRRGEEDESIGQFVRRRFGAEAVTYIAEPLLAGIHAGDVERLSMRMLFPRLVDAEARAGSVIRGARSERQPAVPDGPFRSFPGGIAEIVEGLLRALPPDTVRVQSPAARLSRRADGFVIEFDGHPPVRARSVLLAVPAFAAAPLLAAMHPELARLCGSIPYVSTATVVMAFPRSAVPHPLDGSGFVVPRVEGLAITAGAWISSKWPGRAPDDVALMRAFLGGARNPEILAESDDALTATAVGEMSRILGIRETPAMTRVYRWPRSSPQQEVGHAELMHRIDTMLDLLPGLFLSAAGFRGVGIPDCIGDARATAARAAAYITASRVA